MSVGYSRSTTALQLTTAAGADALLLEALRGEESLSSPFHFTLTMLSEQFDLDLSTVLGTEATVTLVTADGTKRYVHGIVTRIAHAGRDAVFALYEAELRPWFWLLTLTADRRIYQQKSVIDIAKAIFDELGFSHYRDATQGTHTARDYCVQYGESAFDFLSRLFEEEGIHYYFEHTDSAHTLVLADDSDAHQALAAPETVHYAVSASDVEDDDIVTACTLEKSLSPTGYTIGDYDFTKPATKLSTGVTDVPKTQLYAYPGGFTETDAGDSLAKLRLESHETDTTVLRGMSTVRTFTPGATFSLTDHDRSDLNQTYLIRSVRHTATTTGYSNAFEAMPSTVPFRARSGVPKPRAYGAETAIVVGKSGEEIWTDQYGRVKVQFHWDRKGQNDENSSCWVRVAQVWAGKSWGTLFTPRVGQEVVVSFLDGDPDRPIITGTVYNATQAVPYTLPDDQTKSTIKTNSSKGGGGSNEIRFEDKKDSEELYVHAQKDAKIEVENDRTTTIKNNETVTVTKARSITVSEGDDSHTISQGKRTVTVTQGDDAHTVGGKRTVDVTGDETHTNSAKFTHNVTGDYVLKVSGNLTIEASGSVSIKSGTTFAVEAGTALTSKAGTDLTNEATANLKNKGVQIANEASAQLTNKAPTVSNEADAQLNNKSSGLQNVEAGGILVVKGALVKIN